MKTITDFNSNKTEILVDFKEDTKKVAQFLSNDKKDGVKKCWYETHTQMNGMQALDTKEMFETQKTSYINAGMDLYKVIEKDNYKGLHKVKLHIFNKSNQVDGEANWNCGAIKNLKNEIVVDFVSIYFDYLPGDWERVIVEVIFNKPVETPKKKKRK